MLRKIKELFSSLFKRGVYYVGSSDILPPPLSKEEEIYYVSGVKNKK